MLAGDVARHGERFQVHLRPHDGRTEVEQHTAFEILDRPGEDEEIAVACASMSGAVAVRVFVQDIVTDADMDRSRDREAPRRRKHAPVPVRIIAFGDALSDVLAEAESLARGFRDPVVQLAGFAP